MKRIHYLPLFLAVCLLTACRTEVSTLEMLIPQPREASLTSHRLYPAADIVVSAPDTVPADWNAERYSLTIRKGQATIVCATPQAEVWARRTLDQLKDDQGRWPEVVIEDWPEFPLRGFLFDTGRNWIPVTLIKHYIDILSDYKLNAFHWHLTDNPAWRIQSYCHPELNDGQYQTKDRDQGRFYTYDEIRDVIAYARERGVMVIPEIDMPGHSRYFDATFGTAMHTDEGRAILEECIAEFCREIPADLCPYFHIGSDEVRVPDPDGFMRWAENTVRSHGRIAMAWDPGLVCDSLTVRQVWRGGIITTEKGRNHSPYVDSSMGYLNNEDPELNPYRVYFHTPCFTGQSSDHALGGILCLWNDVRQPEKELLAPHSGMCGGVMAFAERFWNGGVKSEGGLSSNFVAPDSSKMQEYMRFQQRMVYHKTHLHPDDMAYWQPVQPTPWELHLQWNDRDTTVTAYGDVIQLSELYNSLHISNRDTVYCTARRQLVSPRARTAQVRIGFESTSRSNRIADGIPQQGEWPCQGSVTVNGVAVEPPVWQEPGAYCYHTNVRDKDENPITNEQLYWMRPAQPVALQKGVNEIEFRAVRAFNSGRFVLAFQEVTME